jgi:hypothetical protein
MVELLLKTFNMEDLGLRYEMAVLLDLDPTWDAPNRCVYKKIVDGEYTYPLIPEHDVSIDVIDKEFNAQDWNYTLTRFIEADGMTVYSATDTRFSIEIEYMPTAALAMCHLFLAIHNQLKR